MHTIGVKLWFLMDGGAALLLPLSVRQQTEVSGKKGIFEMRSSGSTDPSTEASKHRYVLRLRENVKLNKTMGSKRCEWCGECRLTPCCEYRITTL